MPLPYTNKTRLLLDVCKELHTDDTCTATVAQGMAAISLSETGFGLFGAFHKEATADAPGFDSFNFGAMQCPQRPVDGVCPEGCFPLGDTSPERGAYLACFATYPDEHAGAVAFVKLLTVSRPKIASALASGDTCALSLAMYEAHYYEGTGATPKDRVRNHCKALQRQADLVADKTAEPHYWTTIEPPPPPPPAEQHERAEGVGIGVGATVVVVALGRVVLRRLGVSA